jgi:hypothetical protein
MPDATRFLILQFTDDRIKQLVVGVGHVRQPEIIEGHRKVEADAWHRSFSKRKKAGLSSGLPTHTFNKNS